MSEGFGIPDDADFIPDVGFLYLDESNTVLSTSLSSSTITTAVINSNTGTVTTLARDSFSYIEVDTVGESDMSENGYAYVQTSMPMFDQSATQFLVLNDAPVF